MSRRSGNWKLRLVTLFVVAILLVLVVGAAELIARSLEGAHIGMKNNRHSRLGWLPIPGKHTIRTPEFKKTVFINKYGMNDRPMRDADFYLANRILVLGDSHTFAIGASTQEAYPNVLESILYPDGRGGTVYNAAVVGYSVGQYLERFRLLVDVVKPTLAIVGFSMATDLYDVIPPERGGFVYRKNTKRTYFDLDSKSELIEKHFTKRQQKGVGANRSISLTIRDFLGRFVLYRRMSRSKIAMWVATHYRPGGKSLWPGLDTALKKRLTGDDAYRWRLAEKVLGRLTSEARQKGIRVVIVNIPYLAQVYDDVWEASFGSRPDTYDRWIASKRLSAVCKRIGAVCIDTTSAFVERVRQLGRWLHWHQDNHPTPEGQRLIAEVVAKQLRSAGLVE